MKKIDFKRRRLVRGITLSGCLAASGWPVLGATSRGQAIVTPVTNRITLLTGIGGNVVLFKGRDNLSVIDSGSLDMSTSLVAAIKEQAGALPVKNLFNTHWHEDHTGGNEELRAMGASIIAHENTRLWLGADFDVEWRHWHHAPRPEAALPDETFYESGHKDLGGETVQYHHFEQSHTDGDIALFFPDSNVMVAGGLVTDGSYPITDIATGGWIGGLIEANKAMLEIVNDDTIIIPDQGPARTTADLASQLAMLEDLYGTMKSLAQQGFSGHNMLEEGITSDYDAQWGDPAEFILETYRGMWAHTYDMGGFI